METFSTATPRARVAPATNQLQPHAVWRLFSSVQFSYYIKVGVRVDGDDETQRKEHEREGDQEETRHRVLACACVPLEPHS